jgi:hypothetical protein
VPGELGGRYTGADMHSRDACVDDLIANDAHT